MLLEVRDLQIDYRVDRRWWPAVYGVNLSVQHGEVLGIVGESGCGKSTLARAILRLLPHNGRISSGEVRFDGRDLVTMPERELREIRWARIAVIFQGALTVLDPVHTVGQQIVEAIRVHRPHVSRADAWKQVEHLLEEVGIEARRARTYPHELSGGMRQRVGIAMALALSPDLVIADEPTTALDVIVQDNVLEILTSRQKERGFSMILVSHDMGVIAETCDRVAVMYAGTIVEIGSVREIFKDPGHPYTLGLRGAIPRILQEGPSVSIPGHPPAITSPRSECRFRPRCPFAEAICEQSPPWVALRPGHYELCHFPDRKALFQKLADRPDTWARVSDIELSA